MTFTTLSEVTHKTGWRLPFNDKSEPNDIMKALEIMNGNIEKHKNNPKFYQTVATYYAKVEKDMDKAILYLKMALYTEETSAAHFLGIIYDDGWDDGFYGDGEKLGIEDDEKAEKYYRLSIEAGDESHESTYYLGNLLKRQGRYKGALKCYSNAVDDEYIGIQDSMRYILNKMGVTVDVMRKLVC